MKKLQFQIEFFDIYCLKYCGVFAEEVNPE
jgi:hypothetical protein